MIHNYMHEDTHPFAGADLHSVEKLGGHLLPKPHIMIYAPNLRYSTWHSAKSKIRPTALNCIFSMPSPSYVTLLNV